MRQEFGPQFPIPPEKLKELKRQSLREQREAGKKKPTTMAEISDLAEKRMEEEREPLEPTAESRLFIEEEGKFLSNRQQKLLKAWAYFGEKQIKAVFDMLTGEATASTYYRNREEQKEIAESLRALVLLYEDTDILEREREYPAARKMLKDVDKYLNAVEKLPFEQSMALVWKNITTRIEAFNQMILLKDARTADQKSHVFWLLNNLRALISARAPTVEFNRPKPELRNFLKNIQEAAQASPDSRGQSDLNEGAAKSIEVLGQEVEKKQSYEHIPISISKEDSLGLRSELIKLVQEKGATVTWWEGDPKPKEIKLDSDDAKKYFGGKGATIWYKEDSGVIRIYADRNWQEGKPCYAVIEKNGEIRSEVSIRSDAPDSKKTAEIARDITSETWREFLYSVAHYAREYKPEKPPTAGA